MEVDPEFWAYATWFRLAIIIAGIVAILLGFLLFRLRIRASGDLKATLGDVQLNVNTTAPGTFLPSWEPPSLPPWYIKATPVTRGAAATAKLSELLRDPNGSSQQLVRWMRTRRGALPVTGYRMGFWQHTSAALTYEAWEMIKLLWRHSPQASALKMRLSSRQLARYERWLKFTLRKAGLPKPYRSPELLQE
jgi:hypothetical protein